jgi:hypothetical protein
LSTLAGHLIYALTVLFLARRIVSFTIPWRSLITSLLNAIVMGYLLVATQSYFPTIFAVLLSGMTYLLLCFITDLLGRREWLYLRQLLNRN